VCVDSGGRIVLVNAQAERMFGYGREELTGQLVEILVPDAIKAGHPARRAEYVADPQPRPTGAGIELTGRRRDGSTFPAEIALSAIDTDEGILVSAAIRDVSERLELLADRDRLKTQAERDRLERQHQQAQRLESLGQLAGGIAHDDNNLLAVILSYATFASEELAREAAQVDRQSVRDDIQRIQLATERTAALTRQPVRETSPPLATEGGTGETVLVVDDEIALREATRRILARHGYQVITAANGRDAVEVATSHRGFIDLLVTDVIMPQLDGKEAADRIRALYPSVKVLFMSGCTEGILGAQGVLEAGINLIEKPFTEKSLLAKLREVIALAADQPKDQAESGGTEGSAP